MKSNHSRMARGSRNASMPNSSAAAPDNDAKTSRTNTNKSHCANISTAMQIHEHSPSH